MPANAASIGSTRSAIIWSRTSCRRHKRGWKGGHRARARAPPRPGRASRAKRPLGTRARSRPEPNSVSCFSPAGQRMQPPQPYAAPLVIGSGEPDMLFARFRKQSDAPPLLPSLLLLLAVGALATQLERARGATGAFGTRRSTDEPPSWQRERGREPDRGREATSPWQIPWEGWKDIFWRTYQQIGEDRLLAVAAGVVFYGLLALFPAITAFVSFYGLFAKGATINDHLSL